MEKIATGMMSAFFGLDRAYGDYDMVNLTKDYKNKIKGENNITIHGPVNIELWSRHLKGNISLGIIPIMDDSTCRFGAIDIDVYQGLDVKSVIKEIYKSKMPVIPCRTKSGGLHCFCFVKEPVPAPLMKEKLSMFASYLGFGGSEIFPKQGKVLSDRGDLGNWINMPYYKYDDTDRYAYDQFGKPLTIKKFLKRVKNIDFSAMDLQAFNLTLHSDISDGPPCLQTLITKGFETGTRNDGLLNIGIYLKKKNPDNWESEFDDYNQKYMNGPLGSSEVQSLLKSIANNDYNYTCDKPPIKNCCDSKTCRIRKYGVGDMSTLPELTGLTKYDSNPPVWFVDVEDGGRLEMTTEDLQSQQKFQRRCMETLNIMPSPMGSKSWQLLIQKLLENVTIIIAPKDASPKGMLFEHLEYYCTGRAQAKTKEEILMGKPWTDKGKHYFRLLDFMSYLERMRFKEFKVGKISSMLKENGGESKPVNLKGKFLNLWAIPEFAKQTENFDLAKIEGNHVF